jgi:hypothetical protein
MTHEHLQVELPESLSCSACRGSMRYAFQIGDVNRRISQEHFIYFQCTACGLISLANVPEDLGRYYPQGYGLIPQSDDAIEAGLLHEQYKIDLVKRFAGGGRLVEIGPSWGAFCLLASRAGFSVQAIEMNRECCEFINQRFGLQALNSRDEVATLRELSSPDVIVMWHVIEHLRDPWALIAQAVEKLAPGGIVVLATPNPDAIQFRLLGRFWTHVDAPRHVHLIPIALMRQKLSALGLEELLTTTRDEGSLGWNEFGWSFSLAGFVSGFWPKRILRITGRILARLAAFFESREGRGSAYTAIFRKPPIQ